MVGMDVYGLALFGWGFFNLFRSVFFCCRQVCGGAGQSQIAAVLPVRPLVRPLGSDLDYPFTIALFGPEKGATPFGGGWGRSSNSQ